MGREFELKFRSTAVKQQLIQEALGGEWVRMDMESTYYDTPGRELGRLRWTLRRRFENGRSVCTIKTPAPGGGRGEWETECQDIMAAIPVLCNLGCPAELTNFTADGLEAVCGAKFTRLATRIDLEDCQVELALDQGWLLAGDRKRRLCEVEVEVKSGSEAGAAAWAKALAHHYDLRPEKKSKYRRALELSPQP